MSGPPALPGRWPSAWPDLWPAVLFRAAFALTACLVAVVGLAWLGDLALSWWVPLLPAVLLIGPLRRPGRVRRRFAAEAAAGRLRVGAGPGGAPVFGPLASVTAELRADGAVRYVDDRPRGVARRRR